MEMEANGVEGRRGVNLVYFLCRKGRIEHPHLLRVHHFHGNVLRLRDVKRWISDVRGDGMPDRFAWSYKRRYKGGYIWQDLMDDDLITPVSDDEYVLKGSQTSNFSHERVHTNPGSESSVSKSSIGKKPPLKTSFMT